MPPSSEDFFVRFLAMLAQVTFASVLGGVIGTGCAFLISRSMRMRATAVPFLRLTLWLPFLFCWIFQSSLFAGVAAVTLASAYYYLVRKLYEQRRSELLRAIVFQAFFVFLVSQVWSAYGWHWFTEEGLLRATLLFLGFSFLLNWFLRYDFDRDTRVKAAILSEEIATYRSPRRDLMIAAAGLVVAVSMSGALLRSIGLSLVEILIGVLVSCGIGLLVCVVLSTRNVFASILVTFLPVTYIVPIVIPLFLLYNSAFFTLYWQTMTGIATLSFFPSVEILWGLRERGTRQRILLAAENALPFAFVAMLFGETMNAFMGLGFVLAAARNASEIAAASLATAGLFLGLSTMLRWGARGFGPGEKRS